MRTCNNIHKIPPINEEYLQDNTQKKTIQSKSEYKKKYLLEKILIVEDNLNFANTLYETLNEFASEIIIACDGQKALNIINNLKPYIILLDLHIPKINGLKLLTQIKKGNNIIILSGQTKYINKIHIENYEIIKSVLIKPIDMKEVYNKVEYLLEQREKEKITLNIKKILDNFEFNKTSNGYTYIVECLNEIVDEPLNLRNIENVLYKKVASRHFNNNSHNVKWNIDKSLASMCRYTEKNILQRYFGNINNITAKKFLREIYDVLQINGY